MPEKLYLACQACGEVFEGNEPEIAYVHLETCPEALDGRELGNFKILPESEAF